MLSSLWLLGPSRSAVTSGSGYVCGSSWVLSPWLFPSHCSWLESVLVVFSSLIWGETCCLDVIIVICMWGSSVDDHGCGAFCVRLLACLRVKFFRVYFIFLFWFLLGTKEGWKSCVRLGLCAPGAWAPLGLIWGPWSCSLCCTTQFNVLVA